jgi:hypothetical protein
MNNYVLLYSGGQMPETEAEQAAVMQDWGVWYGQLGASVVDGGRPFTPQARTVASNGEVSEGAVGTLATGYTIVKAGSLDEAVEMAKGCPVLKGGGQISVYETIDMSM